MNCIVVVDKNWAIGKDNDLLVHLPGDLKYYKEKTTGKVIVIGRKTLESFPGGRPLPNRTNLVLTGNIEYNNDHCIVCHGKEQMDEELKKYNDQDIFVSGGQSIYQLFLEQCNTVYVTKIDAEYPADRYFKNLDEDPAFKITWQSDVKEDNGTKYRFLKYERI